MKTTSCHLPVTSGRRAVESPPYQPRQARRSIGTQVGRGVLTAPKAQPKRSAEFIPLPHGQRLDAGRRVRARSGINSALRCICENHRSLRRLLSLPLTAPLAQKGVSRSGLVLLALIIALVTVPVRLAPAAEGVNELLQKGLFEEEANHNLDAAIKAYQSVITQQDDQRKLAATAVFRLGECYRKLGRTNEATAQYERILSDFAEQPSLAALSRQYLGQTASEQSAPSRASNDAQATQRKLVELRAEYDQARTLNATLKGMPRSQQKQVIPTVAPDPLLEKLMAQMATAEQKVAELSDTFGPDQPDRKSATTIAKTIQAQIEERLDAVLAGLSLRESATKSVLDDFTQEWKKSREEATPQPAAAAGATDAEEKELREIKAIIKDSPD